MGNSQVKTVRTEETLPVKQQKTWLYQQTKTEIAKVIWGKWAQTKVKDKKTQHA